MLILTIVHLHITMDHFYFILFYSPYISACDLVSTVVCLWFRKVNLLACEDKVKPNYFLLISSLRELQIDYVESKRSTSETSNSHAKSGRAGSGP